MPDEKEAERQNEAMVCALAQEMGWTPEEIEMVLARVTAPMDGFRHSIMSAQMLVQMAGHDRNMWQRCLFGTDSAGVIGTKPLASVLDFDSDEGKQRRAEARAYAQSFRAGLGESRRHYTTAAYFQGQLGSTPGFVDVKADDADDAGVDPGALAEARAASELNERMDEIIKIAGTRARGGGYAKTDRRRMKEAGKRGIRDVNGAAKSGGEMFAAASEALGDGR